MRKRPAGRRDVFLWQVLVWQHICLPLLSMSFGEELLKKINKKFEPSSSVSLRYRSYDLVLITDKEGNAIQLFMGKAKENGAIKGDRYARTLKYDREGKLIKDHWERKGKAS